MKPQKTMLAWGSRALTVGEALTDGMGSTIFIGSS